MLRRVKHKTERPWPLVSLWHCFVGLDWPTFRIPLCKYHSRENVPQHRDFLQHRRKLTKRPSCCTLTSITPLFIKVMTPMGCFPLEALSYGDVWESLSTTLSGFDESALGYMHPETPLLRLLSLCSRSKSSLTAPLFHSGIFPNKTLAYLISFFGVCFPENLKKHNEKETNFYFIYCYWDFLSLTNETNFKHYTGTMDNQEISIHYFYAPKPWMTSRKLLLCFCLSFVLFGEFHFLWGKMYIFPLSHKFAYNVVGFTDCWKPTGVHEQQDKNPFLRWLLLRKFFQGNIFRFNLSIVLSLPL